MPDKLIPPPQIAYNGDPTHQTEADAFIARLIDNPAIMARALNVIVEPPSVEGFLAFANPGQSKTISERILVLHAAWNFLDEAGASASKFRFDRPTEAVLANDPKLKALTTAHHATINMPDRNATVTRQIRARRLSIFAARLTISNKQQAKLTQAA